MGNAFEETGASPQSANDSFKRNRKALRWESIIDVKDTTHPSGPDVEFTPYDDGIDRLPLQLLTAPVECEPLALYPD
eukprot:5444114-Lingulodinium_polyedra.AAC.1